MTTLALRSLWLQLHKWLGLIFAVILIPLSFTGSLLVWDEPIDRLLRPAHYAASAPASLPASAYIAIAQRSLPAGSRIVSLSLGEGPVQVMAMPAGSGARRGPPLRMGAWIDPATARLIDVGPSTSPLVQWAHRFHGSLQLPAAGRAIVGWLGVAMLLSSLTGIWLWWPVRGRVARGLRWRRQPDLDANLHHQVGFWMALPLAMLSLTGVIIAWPQMIGSSIGPRRLGPAAPLARPQLSIDAVLQGVPRSSKLLVTWPTDRSPTWQVKASSVDLTVDDRTGQRSASQGGRARSRPLYRRLHDGTGMGIVWQMAIFMAGIAPAVLGVTGILMWLRSRRWRGDVSRRRAASAAA
jgi:uncharacterized iron-regulated membrane protein